MVSFVPFGLLLLNVLVTISAIPTMVPLVVPTGIKLLCYSTCCNTAAVANLSREVMKPRGGFPKPIMNLDAWRAWLAPLVMSADFHQLFFVVIFMSGKPQPVAVVPLAARALLLAMAFANKSFAGNSIWERYGRNGLYAFVERNLLQLMQAVALVEVSLGFVLVLEAVVSLGRGIMRVFLYWNFLKLKYAFEQRRYADAPTRRYHTQVWNQLQNSVADPVCRRLPIAQRGIDAAVRWFTS